MSFGLLLAPGSTSPGDGGGETVVDTTTRFVIELVRGDLVLPLTGVFRVLAGAEGLDDDEPQFVEEDLPDLDGTVDLGVAYGAREVFLPLLVDAESGAAWEAARAHLRALTNPKLGRTTVRVTRPDGTGREITGRAVLRRGPWDVDNWSVRGWQTLGLLVHCSSPWWRTPAGVSERWVTPATTSWFDSDIGALQLEPDAVWGTPRTVTVAGDAETWPTVTVVGEAGVLTVASGGRSWVVDCTGLTSPVTIVTEPTRTSITDGTGARQWGRLAPPVDFWPLQPGEQQVTVTTSTSTVDAPVVDLVADTLHAAALT